MDSFESLVGTVKDPGALRNVALLGGYHAGKSSVVNFIYKRAGLAVEQGGHRPLRVTDTRIEEHERGLTIKSKVVSIKAVAASGREAFVNLVDTPGHFELSGEVSAALRICDGALLVVDYAQGVTPAMENYIRLALSEKVRLSLFINKVDIGILVYEQTPEEVYQTCQKIIDEVNLLVQSRGMLEHLIDPSVGNVAFGSALHGWAFTIPEFAEKYAKKSLLSASDLCYKLWGDSYFSKAIKKWTTSEASPKERGFAQFILEPISRLLKASAERDWSQLDKILAAVSVKLLDHEKKESCSSEFIRMVMSKWIPAAHSLSNLIVEHLPSAVETQVLRVPYFYGDSDEVSAQMEASDPNGLLVMQIVKLELDPNSAEPSQFLAIGRIFSGTLKARQEVRIMGPEYQRGKRTDFQVKIIGDISIYIGGQLVSVPEIGAGNLVAIQGIGRFINRTATIADKDKVGPMKALKLMSKTLLKVPLNPINPADQPRLLEGLKKLTASDHYANAVTEESGEVFLFGCGELHLELSISDLRQHFVKKEIEDGDPQVLYRETVTAESSELLLAKSPNKNSRFYMKAQPISDNLLSFLEETDYNFGIEKHFTEANKWSLEYNDQQASRRIVFEQNQFEELKDQRIWCFGPDYQGSNVFVCQANKVNYLEEIQTPIQRSFQWISTEGPLCESQLRGVRFDLKECVLPVDAMHRGPGQIIPTIRRLCYGSMLMAKPQLLEPEVQVQLRAPETVLGQVYELFSSRRGSLLTSEATHWNFQDITGKLPLSETFGLSKVVRGITQGKGSCSYMFDSWRAVPGDPLEEGSDANDLVRKLREVRGLNPEIEVGRFADIVPQ